MRVVNKEITDICLEAANLKAEIMYCKAENTRLKSEVEFLRELLGQSINRLANEKYCERCPMKIHSKAISNLPSCNDCGKQKFCASVPPLGEWARINCMHWQKGESNGIG